MENIMALALALGACLALLFPVSYAAVSHTVGGATGWTTPSSPFFYSSWVASQSSFSVGDFLVFNYAGSTQTVAEVTKSAYDSCSALNPITQVNNGPVNVTITSPGPHYYISTDPGHCSSGQKFFITASSPKAPPPTATATPPSPAAPTPKSTTAPTPKSGAASSPSGAMTPAASTPTSTPTGKGGAMTPSTTPSSPATTPMASPMAPATTPMAAPMAPETTPMAAPMAPETTPMAAPMAPVTTPEMAPSTSSGFAPEPSMESGAPMGTARSPPAGGPGASSSPAADGSSMTPAEAPNGKNYAPAARIPGLMFLLVLMLINFLF